MATIPIPPYSLGAGAEPEYPTGDNRPLGETPIHRDNLLNAVKVLDRHFADEPQVYVSGNMFVYYERGNRHKHVSPDVFVAVGVPKDKPRDAYFVWEEAHGLDFVVELTSRSTKEEDLDDKMAIYQDEEERELALEAELDVARAERERAESERERAEAELQRLRLEFAEWRQRFGGQSGIP